MLLSKGLGRDAALCRRWWVPSRQTCQAQLGRELTNVMMASPRSLQVPPLVCCGRAVPLCCSWCRRVTERSRWMWSQQQQTNATTDVGIAATRKDPSLGRIHFYDAPSELGSLLREALWADASGLVLVRGKYHRQEGLCTSDLDGGWTRRRGNTRRRKKGRARTQSSPLACLVPEWSEL